VTISLISRKIFENMAAETGNLPLKVGEFICMHIVLCDRNKAIICAIPLGIDGSHCFIEFLPVVAER
jgi:hypothetical protein